LPGGVWNVRAKCPHATRKHWPTFRTTGEKEVAGMSEPQEKEKEKEEFGMSDEQPPKTREERKGRPSHVIDFTQLIQCFTFVGRNMDLEKKHLISSTKCNEKV